jgi:signal transduction histidine kinase
LESSGTNMTQDPLIEGIVVNSRDVTEKIQLRQQLEQQETQKEQEISVSILHAEEKERNRIGQELHDNINQRLTAVQLYLEHMQTEVTSRDVLIRKTHQMLQSTIQEIRRLSHGLVLTGVEDLPHAITELAGDLLSPSQTQFHISMVSIEFPLPAAFKFVLYRIIQEQLTNIAKYAGASLVSVTLRKEKSTLELIIVDSGKGFDPSLKTRGIGLVGIATRARVFQGEVAIESAPGKGCRLHVRFPEKGIRRTTQASSHTSKE